MRLNILAALSALALAHSATAAEQRSLLLKTNEVKGYGKRDRVFYGSEQSVSPSQLHEVYGARVDAGVQYDTANSRDTGEKATTKAPTAAVRGYWGGDMATLGIGGSYTNSTTATVDGANYEENVRSQKFLPSAAITFTPNLTLGASSDVNWINIKQQNDTLSSQEETYKTYLHRESIGLSFHTPKLEVGVAYVTPASYSMTAEESVVQRPAGFFGLFSSETEAGRRSVYLPAHGTVFARGNLTDHFSMQSAVSHVQYDKNIEGSDLSFERFRTNDRLAGQLQAVYWMRDLATRLAVTGSYRGATYAPYGTEENGLGYRNANLYGGSIDGAVELRDRTYVGLSVGYLRGERTQDLTDGNRVSSREERAKIATTLNMNI